jgi:hypothetical protein
MFNSVEHRSVLSSTMPQAPVQTCFEFEMLMMGLWKTLKAPNNKYASGLSYTCTGVLNIFRPCAGVLIILESILDSDVYLPDYPVRLLLKTRIFHNPAT